MTTRRRAPGAGVPLALLVSLAQCSDSYTAHEFTPPDLGTAGRFDFATTTTTPDLATSPAPTITAVAPSVGSNAGSTPLTITGTGFQAGATVTVAGVACSGVKVVAATSITCTTAGKAATCGPTDLVVTNPDQQKASSKKFAYTPRSTMLAAGQNIANGAGSRGAVWADFNGDGKNDIANLNAAGSSTINVQLGNGDGTFAASKTTTLAAGQVPSALAVGDVDDNGAPDLVVVLTGMAATPQVLVLLGQKDGTFKAQAGGAVALTKNSAPVAVAVATADSQAKPYVVVAGTVSNAGNLDVLQNDGTGVLSALTSKSVGGGGASHMVLADTWGNYAAADEHRVIGRVRQLAQLSSAAAKIRPVTSIIALSDAAGAARAASTRVEYDGLPWLMRTPPRNKSTSCAPASAIMTSATT